MTLVDRIFVGGIAPLPPEGHPTGIFKHAVDAPVMLNAEGLAGDAQADRRVVVNSQALAEMPAALATAGIVSCPWAMAVKISSSTAAIRAALSQ